MTRALVVFAAGIAVGAALVLLGFIAGAATAAGPSRPAPVVLQPLPRPDVGDVPAAVPPTRHLADPDADRADPVRRPAGSEAPPSETPAPSNRPLRASAPGVAGIASWYGTSGPGIYAAAGPALRVGHWRGRTVEVCAGTLCLDVRLVDWCACGDRPGGPTVIDLSRDAFARLAPPSRGLVEVTVRWN